MSYYRLLGTLLPLWLLTTLTGQAEGIHPRLSRARFDSLVAQLPRHRADTSRVLLLLQLSEDMVMESDKSDPRFDLAKSYAQQATALSEKLGFAAGRIGSLYVAGRLHGIIFKDTLGRGMLRQGIALSQRLGYRRHEAFGWFHLGESYWHDASTLPRQLAYFQRARALFRQVGDQINDTFLLKSVADIHHLQGHLEQAIQELLEVEKRYKAAGQRRLHNTYDLLSAVHYAAGNAEEALRYGLAAIESAQATRDTTSIGLFYDNAATLCNELGQTARAVAFHRKALLHAQQTNNAYLGLISSGRLALLLITQHQPEQALAQFRAGIRSIHLTEADSFRYSQYLAECYMALGRYSFAEQQLLRFVRHPALVRGKIDEIALCQSLGKLYLATKQYKKARKYLQQSVELRRQLNYVSILSAARLHLLLFKVDSAQGQFPGAIAHYQQYKLLNDSLFNEKKNKQLASLQIQYDTRKKEQNIALLTKQAQAQQARIRQREWQRNAMVIGALLLTTLLGLSYNRYRLKQRSNRLLEAQQAEINRQNASLQHLLTEKDWMLKEIHHRVKNNLEVISSLLETQLDYLRDPSALIALREGQNRVHAMALIHQKLYQSHSLSVVDMAAYIREIAEHLVESFDCQDTVHLHLNVAPIELDITLATPLGLIINEALTNALKYAWPRPQPGNIRIGLTEVDARHLQLVIEDDGAGFPAGFDMEDGRTMGLTIMRGLSGQLDGRLRITQTPGVRVSLEFEVATGSVPARME
jgi:two-component sensor histidine kinase